MKILFIGGTGNISTSVSRLAVDRGIDLYLLNRGRTGISIPGAKTLVGDINDPVGAGNLLKEHTWDAVVNWIAFTPEQVIRDIALFSGKTRQYIFISSASCYQKPVTNPIITESTPLHNPYWEYSRNKIACEDILTAAYRDKEFPVTIVRPSHTYDTILPIPLGGSGTSTVLDRIRKNKPVIVHGDGTSLWVLTHSRDFAQGFSGLMGNMAAVGHAFHITSDEVLTWNQIIETIAAALHREANIIHIDSQTICSRFPEFTGSLIGDKSNSVIFDNTKIKRFVPGYQAVIPFREGILETIEKFDTVPRLMVIDEEKNRAFDRFIEEMKHFRAAGVRDTK
jgi:nucleoside-diphosphate-sugar epimerase